MAINEGVKLLKQKVRSVTDEDRKRLETFSYSKLDVLNQCPHRFNFQYNEKLRDPVDTLALNIGTLTHYVLECKGRMLKYEGTVNYEELERILIDGFDEDGGHKPGVNELRRKYFEEWYTKDDKSGMDYNEKVEVFKKVLRTEMEDSNWSPVFFERKFEFVYKGTGGEYIIMGFIDRIDVNKQSGAYRVVDYKSGKQVFDKSHTVTAPQQGIYGLAILNEFGVLPEEYLYRFTLIDDFCTAMTKGYEKRLEKKLTAWFEKYEEYKSSGEYPPKPTALCYFCPYRLDSSVKGAYNDRCKYYCLWTRENKTFEKIQLYGDAPKTTQPLKQPAIQRKLIF